MFFDIKKNISQILLAPKFHCLLYDSRNNMSMVTKISIDSSLESVNLGT